MHTVMQTHSNQKDSQTWRLWTAICIGLLVAVASRKLQQQEEYIFHSRGSSTEATVNELELVKQGQQRDVIGRSSTETVPKQPRQKRDVLIVGSGAAGLAAAAALRKRSFNVQIIEASNTYGGRIKKADDSFADFPIDLGATFVYDPTILKAIAGTEVNVTTVPIQEEYDGEPGYNLFVNYSWHTFLEEYLAPEPGSIAYGCQVNHVKYGSIDKQVSATCDDGRAFQADKIIITAPLSVLQDGDITFDPPLPKRLIDQHPGEMWPGIKFVIEFKDKFYPPIFSLDKDTHTTDSEEEEDDREIEFWDYSKVNENSNRKILAGVFMGRAAEEFIGKNENEMVMHVLRRLDQHFHGKVATEGYVKHIVMDWSKEPFIRGGYASEAANARYSQWGALRARNNLFLAGEAFPYPAGQNGWAHSAALSGKSAARKIIGDLARELKVEPLELLD